MKPLDPVSARLFPSLARYARKMKWVGMAAIGVCLYLVGFQNGLLVGTYRGQVADESYAHMVREFHQFKEDYLKHHAKVLTTTKAQARVIATEIERRQVTP